MDGQYQVETLIAVSEYDAEWQPIDTFVGWPDAYKFAQEQITITPYGDCGVRIYDLFDQDVLWANYN